MQPFAEPIRGTHVQRSPLIKDEPPCAAGTSRINLASISFLISFKDAGGSRTRLELLCRQSPCRLASASQTGQSGEATDQRRSVRVLWSLASGLLPIQCPRQELNLVLDLRRVGCESGTPRGQIRGDQASPRSFSSDTYRSGSACLTASFGSSLP